MKLYLILLVAMAVIAIADARHRSRSRDDDSDDSRVGRPSRRHHRKGAVGSANRNRQAKKRSSDSSEEPQYTKEDRPGRTKDKPRPSLTKQNRRYTKDWPQKNRSKASAAEAVQQAEAAQIQAQETAQEAYQNYLQAQDKVQEAVQEAAAEE